MSNSQAIETNQFFKSLNDFIVYLQKFNNFNDTCICIDTDNDGLLSSVKKTSVIQINSCATKIFIESESFDISNFNEIIKDFTEFIIELEYPSVLFQTIFDKVLEIKKMKKPPNNITIALKLLQQQPNSLPPKFDKNYNIYYINGDISKGSFKGCFNLKKVVLNSFVSSIDDSTFEGCYVLTQITIPSSVTSIGDRAFYGCKSLKQISIPTSVMNLYKQSKLKFYLNVFDVVLM